MGLLKRACGAAAALLLAGGSASATIYDQGMESVTGGPTDVEILGNFAQLPAGKTIYLTLSSGVIDHASWLVDTEWGALWWEIWGWDDSGPQYVLWGNEYPISGYLQGNDDQRIGYAPGHDFHATSTLTPRVASLLVTENVNGFYDCDSVQIVGRDCSLWGELDRASLDRFVVHADRDFTWTLSDTRPVPEPASWVLLIAGSAMVGVALRRRRALPA